MEIIACIKQILDPDLPPAKFIIDPQKNRVIPPRGSPRSSIPMMPWPWKPP